MRDDARRKKRKEKRGNRQQTDKIQKQRLVSQLVAAREVTQQLASAQTTI